MSRRPLIRQGEGPATAYERERQQRTDDQTRIAQLDRDYPDRPDTPNLNAVLSLIGDERQLRGIPAIGRGVAGCIAGTNPSSACIR